MKKKQTAEITVTQSEQMELLPNCLDGELAAEESISFDTFWREDKPLLIVCMGLGRDSLAVLILLYRVGIVPDLIVFANTKGEKKSTYDYIPYLQNWLASIGFPPLTIVEADRTRDDSLEAMSLRLGVLPGISYRSSHTCSVQWKIEALDEYIENFLPAVKSIKAGRKIVRAIGFEANEIYRARRAAKDAVKTTTDEHGCKQTTAFAASDDEKYVSWFPLIQENIDRGGVVDLILDEKLRLPSKSACFYCGASKESEIFELSVNEPHLLFRALVMERAAQRNTVKVHTTIQGLNFGTPWAILECATPYLDRLDEVIERFGLDRAVEDGIRSPKSDLWKPKAHRVKLFIAAFGTKEQLERYMTSGEIDAECDPALNPFDSSGTQKQMFASLPQVGVEAVTAIAPEARAN